jgi:hypothetical protein
MRDVLAAQNQDVPHDGGDHEGNGEMDSSDSAGRNFGVYASSSSEYDVEKQQSATNSSNGDVIHDHVDIQYAEKQFADLKRRYSDLSRVTSHGSRRRIAVDKHAEAGTDEVDSEDEFDLEDMLRDRHRKEVEHDIKPKHLGIQLTGC